MLRHLSRILATAFLPELTPRRTLHRTLLMASLAVPTVVQADQPASVQELNAETWGQLAPQGKEVDAIYGDTVLQNQFLRAVIARPGSSRHANMTIRSVGGCLIDLTTRAQESDQLGAFFPGRRAFPFSELSTAPAENAPAGSAQAVVTSPGTATQPTYTVAWSVGPADRFLTATSTWSNTTAADITLTPEDDLRVDSGKEDIRKPENGSHEFFWCHDLFWKQAYGVYVPGYRIRLKGSSRESVLTYERLDGNPIVLKPGESFSLVRHLFVNTDLPAVLADFESSFRTGTVLQETGLKVLAGDRSVADARIRLFGDNQERGTVVTGADGTATVRLPENIRMAQVTVAGQEFAVQPMNIVDGRAELPLPDYTPGTAEVRIVDEHGHPIPAKVEFTGRNSTPTPNWGPDSAEFLVRNLAYTSTGQVRVDLDSGIYDVIVSHGPEYHAEFMTLDITPGKTTDKVVTLPRLVSTPGWVSADFHSHSTPSGDNTGSQLGRVLNLAAEHVEFAPCTEHNRVSTYADHLQALQLREQLATVSGMELTGQPLPLNHQNIFPMLYTPHTQDGGGPAADLSPETQIERAAAWDNNSVKLIQQNHPDIGWLFFDRNGDQVPDEGYSRSFGLINVMEIHPIDKLLKPGRFDVRNGKPAENHTALNWIQLLNQGFRIYGVVNTDAHYNYHGSGGLRIWVRSETDRPADIQSNAIRDAARDGQIIMSNGPYLEVTVHESGKPQQTVISGDDLLASSGKVTASIRVQCADWLDVDTVMVLVNGRASADRTFNRETHPELFSRETVRFEKTLDMNLPSDAHLIVLTGHSTQVLGAVVGPDWGKQHPAALCNPIFVDVDGNGFQPNRDTLDIPLPVKFAPEK